MKTNIRNKTMFRNADQNDLDFIYESLENLAYEQKIGDRFKTDKLELHENLFGQQKLAEVIIAEINDTPIGLAVFSETNRHFMLFKKSGLYLHDLYILPEYRKQGIATQLIDELRKIAQQRNYGRIDWIVLNDNHLGHQFYSQIKDAVKLDYFQCMRINLSEEEID